MTNMICRDSELSAQTISDTTSHLQENILQALDPKPKSDNQLLCSFVDCETKELPQSQPPEIDACSSNLSTKNVPSEIVTEEQETLKGDYFSNLLKNSIFF